MSGDVWVDDMNNGIWIYGVSGGVWVDYMNDGLWINGVSGDVWVDDMNDGLCIYGVSAVYYTRLTLLTNRVVMIPDVAGTFI